MRLKSKRKKRGDKSKNSVSQRKKRKKKIRGQKWLVRQKLETTIALLLVLVKYNKIYLSTCMEYS